ncbi:MAG: hypothetical protein CW338_07280, partial [Clostridiales bacterium]|nr:hypothetical protein [Clostridiales bacterium]
METTVKQAGGRRFGAALKERKRKILVSLKRKPQMIALIVLLIAFLQYSLQLTVISNTTAKLMLSGMGLCEFVIMLFSILGLVCFLNAFPHRKPVNKWMLGLTFVMFIIVICADIRYRATVVRATRDLDEQVKLLHFSTLAGNLDILSVKEKMAAMCNRENIMTVTDEIRYVDTAKVVMLWNMIINGAGLLLTALLPVYR